MIGRLLSMLGRRSRLTRRLTIAALSLVALSVLASALTRAPRPEPRQSPPPAGSIGTVHSPAAPRHPSPVSVGELPRAREAATRFLAGYLPFLYGRGSAREVDPATPGLRLQLTRTRAQVTPVERRRRPRVVSLTAVGQAPGLVLATALVKDGGVTSYALRITVREGPAGWLVSGVDGG
jgi:hypothetical protein